ncbi:MAG: LuxR C-terminal-related transcriptional regulator [Pirellulaceae bacterium]
MSYNDSHATILVVEPQPVMRLGVLWMLDREPGFEVIGQDGDTNSALSVAKSTQPNLILTELRWPSGTGVHFLGQLCQQCPHAAVVVLTALDESVYAERALAAGARGFFVKHEEPGHLLNGLRDILAGKIVVSDSVAQSLVTSLTASDVLGGEAAIAGLSNRELQVFEMIGQGWSTVEMAQQLGLSVKTVETHRSNLKQKLNIENASRLSRFAMKWSLSYAG